MGSGCDGLPRSIFPPTPSPLFRVSRPTLLEETRRKPEGNQKETTRTPFLKSSPPAPPVRPSGHRSRSFEGTYSEGNFLGPNNLTRPSFSASPSLFWLATLCTLAHFPSCTFPVLFVFLPRLSGFFLKLASSLVQGLPRLEVRPLNWVLVPLLLGNPRESPRKVVRHGKRTLEAPSRWMFFFHPRVGWRNSHRMEDWFCLSGSHEKNTALGVPRALNRKPSASLEKGGGFWSQVVRRSEASNPTNPKQRFVRTREVVIQGFGIRIEASVASAASSSATRSLCISERPEGSFFFFFLLFSPPRRSCNVSSVDM